MRVVPERHPPHGRDPLPAWERCGELPGPSPARSTASSANRPSRIRTIRRTNSAVIQAKPADSAITGASAAPCEIELAFEVIWLRSEAAPMRLA